MINGFVKKMFVVVGDFFHAPKYNAILLHTTSVETINNRLKGFKAKCCECFTTGAESILLSLDFIAFVAQNIKQ